MSTFESTEPKLSDIHGRPGIAGSFEVAVTVQYPGEPAEQIRFGGSVYGGPVVMITPGNPDGVFVSQAVIDRIGRLDPKTDQTRWVRRFFHLDEGDL